MNFRHNYLILCLLVAPTLQAEEPACKATYCNQLLEKGRNALLASLDMGNNTLEFDQAQDFLEEAHMIAKKHLTSFETMISLQYLLILSAIEASRKEFNRKFRSDASDRLEVAYDVLTQYLEKNSPTPEQLSITYETLIVVKDVSNALYQQEKTYKIINRNRSKISYLTLVEKIDQIFLK